MNILRHQDSDFEKTIRELCQRPPFDPAVEKAAREILDDVQANGDRALTKYARKFDGVSLNPDQFRVSEEELDNAADSLDASVKKTIRTAQRQVRDFARQRMPQPWSYSPRKGVIIGERFAPLDRIGAYVPGGTAPLVSTVLHTVTLAAAAGVSEIVVVTPPQPDGRVHPALLYAADKAGATQVFRLGGVYAIGALAYGTETVKKVEKIVGPGNAYVTAAKRHVYGYVSLDLVAGPSEIMILADESANPAFVAADMLSQIEHGSGAESAVLATPSETLLENVQAELLAQSKERERRDTIETCLRNNVHLILVANLEQAAEVASRYAPEHLEIQTQRPGMLAKKVTAAGAVFLGPWTPEPVGDFVAGPSHVLPTGGAARYFSGLTVDAFFRRMSVVNYQKSALRRERETLETFAEIEGLDAHGMSTGIRFREENDS
ncbi:MAG: histidinol dehydrogenase [Candidatus Pacebacteria bacterium]|nr:histidinol dehydrogenase [Candidatus Paceibacterota bacterium]